MEDNRDRLSRHRPGRQSHFIIMTMMAGHRFTVPEKRGSKSSA
jgi:hypothetical protein